MSWTAFGKPRQVSVGAANCAADCTTFTYGPDRQLVKQMVKAAGSTRSIYYIGPHFEVEVGGGVTEYRSHALANGRVVFSQIEDSGGVGWQAYYPLVDHLGSVDKQYQAIGGGAQTLAYSYDAYGRRRNADWSDDPGGTQMTATLWNHRGYTGHEMLDNVQLIHMKGRVYDPTLGRFLSPDPLFDDLSMPQSLNPYGYVAGNPLSYTDPSGHFLSKLRKSVSRLLSGRWAKHVTRELVTVAVYAGCMYGPGAAAEAGGGCSKFALSVGQTMPETGKASRQASSATGGQGQPNLGQFGGGYGGNGSLRMNAVDTMIVNEGEPVWGEVDWKGICGDLVCGFLPGCGEGYDILIIIDPDSTERSRRLAWISLGASIYTGGGSPNYGVLRRIAKRAEEAKAARGIGSLDDLSRAAGALDRSGLSAAGRQLQKHGSRPGSAFPAARGNPSAINQQGQQIVDDILTTPGATSVGRHHARFGDIVEIRSPDGRGLRYGSDGRFLGFLEPRP